jgi:hypothetical protein
MFKPPKTEFINLFEEVEDFVFEVTPVEDELESLFDVPT